MFYEDEVRTVRDSGWDWLIGWFSLYSFYFVTLCGMVDFFMNDESKRTQKETIEAYFEVSSKNLREGNEENREEPRTR
jgi:hypothetical protein